MIRSSHLGFLLLAFMMVTFFVIPETEGVQKPFRIVLCLSFPIIYFALLIKKEISYRTLIPVIGATLFMALMAVRGTLLSTYINAWLCLFGLLCMPVLFFDLTKERKENLRYIYLLAAISILLQFLIFTHSDGRPKMGYEINHSGAYLFLFFIASDILGFKWGKLMVVALSLFIISRLLIFSILIYYMVKYGKQYFTGLIARLNAIKIALMCFAAVSILSFWYASNMHQSISYETGMRRIVRLNDNSNQIRFRTNSLALETIFKLPPDPQALYGYGNVENFLKAKKTTFMPHNELLHSIVEFGLLAVIFFSIFSLSAFNRLVSFTNMEYFIPILFYTSILWVKYLLIPSPEMLFILFLLFIAKTETKPIAQIISLG